MMKKITYSIGFFFLCLGLAHAQTKVSIPNQLAYFSFDNPAKIATDDSGNGSAAFISAVEPTSVCGINGGNAVRFKGVEYIQFVDVANTIVSQDFSISMYIKPTSLIGTRDIFTKKDSCGKGPTISIAYNASNKTIICVVQNSLKSTTVTTKIDESSCWQHIVLIREVANTKLYLNNSLRDQKSTLDGKRINLLSTAIAAIGKSPCDPQSINGHYQGYIDELRVFDRALNVDQIKLLYYPQDHIATQDTLIYIGNSVKANSFNSCATKFQWSPTNGVQSVNEKNTILKPSETTLYTLKYIDNSGCSATDTLRVRVVDPNNVPCGEIFVPNAFTPNSDGKNDKIGISNPYSMEKLVSFEILDRWGARVFTTTDPFELWDGTLDGNQLNPGLFIYRLRYLCAGVEKNQVGNINILR